MNNKVAKLLKLSDFFGKKYLRVNADSLPPEQEAPTNQDFEVFSPAKAPLNMDPNVPSPTSPTSGHFEIFEVKKKILPEFMKLTEEQQAKIIEELARIKARNHKA